MNTHGKAYNPFDLEKPTLRLGEHGEWVLADITEAVQSRMMELSKSVSEALDDSSSVADIARIVGDLCEAACEDSEGLSDLVVSLADPEKHGAKALGVKALAGCVAFIMEWFDLEDGAGEA